MKKIFLFLVIILLLGYPLVSRAHGNLVIAKGPVSDEQDEDSNDTANTVQQGQPEEKQTGSNETDSGNQAKSSDQKASDDSTEEKRGATDEQSSVDSGKMEGSGMQAPLSEAPKTEGIQDPKEILQTGKDQSTIPMPKEGPDGEALPTQPVTTAPQGGPATLMDNSRLNQEVRREDTRETVVNHYYWHDYGGYSYCHYYDPWGYNWYGWYDGPHYYWTRYYDDRWWWYDNSYGRWCYWYNDNWWWQDPHRISVVYVYKDNHYYSDGDSATPTPGFTPVATPPPVALAQTQTRSPDGTRLVKVFGDDAEAFLYDISPHPTFKPTYLVSGVKEVKFSSPHKGKPEQLFVFLKDGTFRKFNVEGNHVRKHHERDKH